MPIFAEWCLICIVFSLTSTSVYWILKCNQGDSSISRVLPAHTWRPVFELRFPSIHIKNKYGSLPPSIEEVDTKGALRLTGQLVCRLIDDLHPQWEILTQQLRWEAIGESAFCECPVIQSCACTCKHLCTNTSCIVHACAHTHTTSL